MRHLFAYWSPKGTPNTSVAKYHGTDRPPRDRSIATRLWIVRVQNGELYLVSMFDVLRWEQDKNRVADHTGEPISYPAKWYALASEPQPIINARITHLADTLRLKRYRKGPNAGQLERQYQFVLKEIKSENARLLEQEWTAAISRYVP